MLFTNKSHKITQVLPFLRSFVPHNFSNNPRYQCLIRERIHSHPFCTENKQNKTNLPKLSDFPEVTWPSVFKTIRNWVLANFIIMRYFDSDFNLPDFVNGSKKAVEVVSDLISRGELNSLDGYVSPEVIAQIKTRLNSFSLKQRQDLSLSAEDMYFCFPYEVGVMFPNEDKDEGENQSRFVEITMVYHALSGLEELKKQGITPPLNMGVLPEYRDKIYICNYRFIREFTKGVQGDWTINAINHFRPADHID
uniref:Tim44-like domain-containing protein n=1 Tax=Clastoptera arizonana TaxID=38151 RepID=A0A1B6BYB6_9HEMI